MKNVIITIKSAQEYDSQDNDSIEFVTGGEYSHKDGITEFTYMESQLTGLEGTKTTFQIKNGDVTMSREGTVNTQMVFQEGRRHYFMYETPFGTVTMGLNTLGITMDMNQNGGQLDIHYVIDMENSALSRNTFNINIREVKNNGQLN